MDWLTGFVNASGEWPTAGSIVGGIAIIIIALRRRRDVDVVEMQKRITTLEQRVNTLEDEREEDRVELAKLRDTLVKRDRALYALRSTLARHGIPDPTAQEAS